MRVSPAEYGGLNLRAHELLRDVPLHDVWAVDLPGGGPGRTLADVRRVQAGLPPSRMAAVLFGVRRLAGRLFGWDRSPMRPEESLAVRLTEQDRLDSQPPTGTPVGAFRLVYQHPAEAVLETRNATVHGFVCLALAPHPLGYRLYLAVYVQPVSWLTRPYLLAIEPFRRFLLYPAMLRRMRGAWIDAYTAAPDRPSLR
jgi:uncharacterized protein DUF2867